MSQDDFEQILPGWQVANQAVAPNLAEWRRAHPKAPLTEIEDAVSSTTPGRPRGVGSRVDDRRPVAWSRRIGDAASTVEVLARSLRAEVTLVHVLPDPFAVATFPTEGEVSNQTRTVMT